jgi:hypothetical protein
MVNGGDTWHIHLGSLVPEGWVGSAHIYSDGWVFPMVDRYKVGYSMWITNTGSAANFENLAQVPGVGGRYALFAPHVLMDYFGWNTGINVANLVNQDNNISIQYFNMLGNATQVLSQRLAAHGMTYFYDPSVAAQNVSAQDVASDPNAGVVGSAIIWSDHPVAAAVDATKYPETDPNGGVDLFQATSYNATQNLYTWQAIPLVQKGNPASGMGATSGINIMNPNPTAATANVYFVNPSGFNASNFGISSVTIPGFANGFVYSLWQHNLPHGFYGAAQVIANVPVAVVSANVDYQVEGDGSAIFNAFNPCGYYRTVDPADADRDCFFGDPFDVTGGSVTKYFVDDSEDKNPVAGVVFQVGNDNPAFPYTRQATSGPDGSAVLTNLPVGNYELHVMAVPAGFTLEGSDIKDEFVLLEGQDVQLTNTIVRFKAEPPTETPNGTPTETPTTSPTEPPNGTPPVEPTPTSPPVEPTPTSPPVEPTPTSPPVEPTPTSPPVEPTPTSPPVEPTPTPTPTVGQIDIDQGYAITGNAAARTVCLLNADDSQFGTVENYCLVLASPPAPDGFFFANVPTGDYKLSVGGTILAVTVSYSATLDIRDTHLADIVNETGATTGQGALRQGGEWDWILQSAGNPTIDLGPGQTQ